MSDISLQFPWWADVFFVLLMGFWPVTVAAACAAVWVCLARRSRVAWIVAIVVGIAWLISAAGNLYGRVDAARSDASMAAYDRAHRRTLDAGTVVVEGMRLPAGTVIVTDEKFKLVSLELSKPAVLFGVPLRDTVSVVDGKLDGSQTLQRNATIDGVPCSAASNATFEKGALTGCLLAHPATVGGAPCRGYVSPGANSVGCELASAYRRYGATWYAGTDARGDDAYFVFTVGSRAPSLRAYGSPLRQGTMVVYRHGAVDMVTLSAPLPYRGCRIAQLERRDGVMTAEVDGPCSLPPLASGRRQVPNF